MDKTMKNTTSATHKNNISKRLIQGVFFGILSGILLGSICYMIMFPKEINTYENRTAEQFPTLIVSNFFNSEFQNKTELALSDQVLGSEYAKKSYNNTESFLSYFVLKKLFQKYPEKYFHYNDICVYNSSYLLFEPRMLTDEMKEKMQVRADSINSLTNAYPNVDFYIYYIEKDTDMNFETNEKMGLYEHLETLIDKNHCKISNYPIDSFEEFSTYFYQTDHHWNHKGAYRAYTQLSSFLGFGTPLETKSEYAIGDGMVGSKTAFAKNTEIWTDQVFGYTYDFPPMSITENGSFVEDYGHQNLPGSSFISEDSPLSYASIYGQDSGEIIFDTGMKHKKNILIIGESYDNAILKLIASHYNKTISIDLRSYDYMMNQTFSFSTYLDEHDIDTVLLIGNVDYFLNTKFNVE